MTIEFRVAMLDRVIVALGGVHAPACKSDDLSDEVWMDLENEVKRQLGINSLRSIAEEESKEVLAVINEYELPLILQRKIQAYNRSELK